MVRRFDRISLAVPDLSQAAAQYEQLLGLPGHMPPELPSAIWWDLSNTVIELLEADVEKPRIEGVTFDCLATERGERILPNALGLQVRGCDGRATAALRVRPAAVQATDMSVDHLVLRTNSAEACIAFFSQELGIRLALDKTVPEWGGRMLFFRTGGLTLEVIESNDKAHGNAFWGLAYQCPDLEHTATALAARGVAISEVRAGRKPGTSVATVKSHCLGIPTLLIQPPE